MIQTNIPQMANDVASGGAANKSLPPRYLLNPLPALLVSLASLVCLMSGLPVWMMLIGWAAFAIRGGSLRDGSYSLACAITGLGLGILAAVATVHWEPALGLLSLPVAMLLVMLSVCVLSFITGVDNVPSHLLGVVAALAAPMDPSLDTYLTLTAAAALGALAVSSDFLTGSNGKRNGEAG